MSEHAINRRRHTCLRYLSDRVAVRLLALTRERLEAAVGLNIVEIA